MCEDSVKLKMALLKEELEGAYMQLANVGRQRDDLKRQLQCFGRNTDIVIPRAQRDALLKQLDDSDRRIDLLGRYIQTLQREHTKHTWVLLGCVFGLAFLLYLK